MTTHERLTAVIRCITLAGIAALSLVVVGTGATAEAAPQQGAFAAVAPCRLLDTRDSGPRPTAGTIIDVQVTGRCNIDPQAIAGSFVVTSTDSTARWYVAVYPANAARPATSNVNYGPGETRASGAIVQLSPQGTIKVYTHSPGHIVVDVNGAWTPTNEPVAAGRFIPVDPRRIADTRSGPRPAARTSIVVPLAGIPADATAVAVNITTADTTSRGFLTAYPTGIAVPNASSLNADNVGQARAAASIVAVGVNSSISVFTQTGQHIIVDISGYFTGPTAETTTTGLFVPTTPRRLLDTRTTSAPVYANGGREVQVPSTSSAQALTVTAINSATRGWWLAYPAGRRPPGAVSSANADGINQVVANLAMPMTGTRGIAVHAYTAIHVIIDTYGYFVGTPQPSPGAVPTNPKPARRRVVIISDSAMAGVRWNGALGGLQGFFPEARLESCRRLVAASCRGREGYAPRTALQEINNSVANATSNRDVLVIATGYNDWYTNFANHFAQVVAAGRARGFKTIVWVTLRSNNSYHMPGTNTLLANSHAIMNQTVRDGMAAGLYPDVQIWDLQQYTRYAPYPGWFAGDGVHETRVGSWGVADWLSRHVAALDGLPCTRPYQPGQPVETLCPHPDLLPLTRGLPDIAALYGL